MDIDHSCIPLKEIHIHPTFSNLFPKSLPVLYGLKKHIRDNGFDIAFPLILAHGPWTQHDVLIDGHCRRQVCEELGIEKVPVVRRFFESEDEAIEYMIHVQKDRRNLTDAGIVNCLEILDKKKKAGRPKKGAQPCANSDRGKSAAALASTLGISTRKLEMARTVAEYGDANMKDDIIAKKLSINKAYQEIRVRRKMEETQTEAQQEDSAEATEVIDKLQEGNIDHEMILSLPLEANDPEDEAREPECWAPGIINGFDSDSIDYVILGQGTSPDTLLENQQVFLAPWIAPRQSDAGTTAKYTPNQETTAPAPPKEPNLVNLTNHDAEGWYELEKQWAKYVPGFVPEPPEGIEVATAIEETSVEGHAATGNERPKSSPEAEAKSVDAGLEKIAVSLELGNGEGTRLEKWAKRYGVIVYTLSDNTRKVDRRKFFALVQSVEELNDVLKGAVKAEYSWFPQTFHRICLENGHDVAVPDCADGFEVNLLLDHLCFKGVYSGGRHHPQNEESITRKLEFLIENWTEVCSDVKKYGFIQDRSDSPSFDWVVRYGENIFDCVHHKMQAIARVQLEQIFGNAGIALS